MVHDVQVLAKIDGTLAKAFKKALIDDEITFKAWLLARIREFLAARGDGK